MEILEAIRVPAPIGRRRRFARAPRRFAESKFSARVSEISSEIHVENVRKHRKNGPSDQLALVLVLFRKPRVFKLLFRNWRRRRLRPQSRNRNATFSHRITPFRLLGLPEVPDASRRRNPLG
jgi:hypothetical protein